MSAHRPYPSIAIIGGGPAGLMAAERLAAFGAVTVYDRMPTMGRKFLMAGRGGLNLTHGESLDTFIARYGDAAPRLGPAIRAFPPDTLRDWCQGLGQATFVGSSGRVFPTAMKSSPLMRAWLARLRSCGVGLAAGHEWRGWDERGDLVFVHAGQTVGVSADATVLALGGASWPRLGSDGNWVDRLTRRGVAVTPLAPANCGLTAGWSALLRDRHAGHPLKPVGLSIDGQMRQGELILTADGLEGGLIYAVAARLRATLAAGRDAVIVLDLKPGLDRDRLAARLARPRGGQSTGAWLRRAAGLDPAVVALLREQRDAHALPDTPDALAALIKAKPICLTGTTDVARAISTAGGVAWDALDERFMLHALPGTFVAGEMVDWEAPTGGYLLQGCFSMAVRAADGVRDYLASR